MKTGVIFFLTDSIIPLFVITVDALPVTLNLMLYMLSIINKMSRIIDNFHWDKPILFEIINCTKSLLVSLGTIWLSNALATI